MMRKSTIFLLVWYAMLIVLIVLAAVFPLLNQSLWDISLWTSTEELVFTLILLVFSLAFFLFIVVQSAALAATQLTRQKIRAILQNKSIRSWSDEDQLLLQLSDKVRHLTQQVQLIDNKDLVKQEEIVEAERKRIARDLHDTVSQELFATSMILSGLAANVSQVPEETLTQQLVLVKEMIETAQRDLRILLLHLRPSELDGKNLVEGFDIILKEVSEKSKMTVHFYHDIEELPKLMEEHLFRIGQEIISNTLRHAHAKHLEVYLVQNESELQLKMVDDGVGFVLGEDEDISYGLKNIQDRVEDMAGTLKIRTAPNKGVAIDIRIPLLKGKDDDENTRNAD